MLNTSTLWLIRSWTLEDKGVQVLTMLMMLQEQDLPQWESSPPRIREGIVDGV